MFTFSIILQAANMRKLTFDFGGIDFNLFHNTSSSYILISSWNNGKLLIPNIQFKTPIPEEDCLIEKRP